MERTFYHYMNTSKAKSVLKSGVLTPCEPLTFLSVNLYGNFDDQLLSGNSQLPEYIVGRSNIPNIFFTITPPEIIFTEELRRGIGTPSFGLEYVIWISEEEISQQGFRIFRNPSQEYPTYYNVPCPDGKGIRIKSELISPVKSPQPNYA